MAVVAPAASAGEVVWGITPSFLRDFYENVIQKHPAWNDAMTSGNVVYEIIKPLTQARALSYIDQSEADSGQTHRKPANIFVSHAWKNSFTELMSALLQEAPESKVSKLSKKPDVVYWLDFIFLNQHVSGPTMIADIERALVTNVSGTGTTLIVCHPWNNPVCIQRSWCTFEIYLTLHTGNKLKVALSSHERAELDKSMQDTGGISGVRDALLGMDVMEAEAQDPADAEKIKARIRRIGVPAVNQLLRSSMAEAYVEQMPTDVTHFALSGGVLGAYMCFYCCILSPLSIAAIVYAVIGPCATVYRLCVALVGAYGLSTLIPTVPLLSHMAKLIHAIASAGVGGWRAVVIARRKLGSAIGTVAKSAMYGLTAGITGLIVSGMVAIAKQGCRPMCSVMWVIVAVMAVIVPVAATRQVPSFSKSAIMDEEDADDSSGTADKTVTAIARCCITCVLWTFALIVGLIAGLHPDMQCANPDFVWQPADP